MAMYDCVCILLNLFLCRLLPMSLCVDYYYVIMATVISKILYTHMIYLDDNFHTTARIDCSSYLVYLLLVPVTIRTFTMRNGYHYYITTKRTPQK